MAAVSSFRYSTGKIATAEAAKSFSWEAPVPVNPFWDSFSYSTARNFLGNFSEHELKQLSVDPLLRNKLAKEEAATSPQSLYEVNYAQWSQLWQGIYILEDELDLPQAEDTIRMLLEKRPDSSNVIPPHMLADHLVKVGKYREAEEVVRPVCQWMDVNPKLGKASPQALSARRTIARALWGQGPSRRSEAEALVAEIHELIDGMAGSKFGIYQEEEASLHKELVAELKLKI
ncbi:unnamed protein product [Penicillium crustosum]